MKIATFNGINYSPPPNIYNVHELKSEQSAYAAQSFRKFNEDKQLKRELIFIDYDLNKKRSYSTKQLIGQARFEKTKQQQFTQYQLINLGKQMKQNINYNYVLPRIQGGYIPHEIDKPLRQMDLVGPSYYQNVQKGYKQITESKFRRSNSSLK